ncbi:isoleucine--tRNA ligase [Conexibacter sp. DBS9H8]|uniref:isoleucine--tRNA ligase n=1 Tax=Conexibacter sp. DBS9H8 TaxID=2937801 RepID=UPI00200D813B|nr:isoleucine--tRNA ligase [Conexibacter sp. DBS9H8]
MAAPDSADRPAADRPAADRPAADRPAPGAPVHRPVDPKPNLPSLESAILARWRDRDVFAESLRRRADAPRWTFYEGPPTANGKPASHHVLARSFKDIFPRYRTMAGYRVDRKGGWDCHGLPVELAAERALGLASKQEIESYGIEAFNQVCRDSVFSNIDDWTALTERIGFWIDTADAYRTLDPAYIESLWWALKTIHAKGLLFEKLKVVPYCPRCGTALSSHELGQPGAYQDDVDLSAYVILPSDAGNLLVWTTTPWTLVSNAAVAVAPDLGYVRARPAPDSPLPAGEYVLAEALLEPVLGPGATVLARFPGAELVGTAYEPPFGFISAADYGAKGHTVLAAGFVTADEGTGLVHTAIAFGEDDFQLGVAEGLAPVNPVRPDGTYDDRITAYAGRKVRDCDEDIVADLRARGRLLKAVPYEHSYPHCWRCDTALIYYAKPSWYIATSQVKDRLLAANETVNWQPPHIKSGRFGQWLEGNVDWALSRERYWGTPLPVWRCPAGHIEVIGSLTELTERSGVSLADPHRPFVDDVHFPCPDCAGEMTRVPEVIDVWFDSGAMPFAQWGAPHVGEADFDAHFPADYICEAIDQTRGWFYSLLAVSTLLFDRSSFANVVCLGHILDEHGQKMSKSKGNVVDPWSVLDRFGADAFRWYLFTSKYPWDGYRFSLEAVGESVTRFLLPLWNVYSFYVLYANASGAADRSGVAPHCGLGGHGGAPAADGGAVASPATGPQAGTGPAAVPDALGDLDRWALSRLAATVEAVGAGLEAFDATGAGRAIADFVEELSNWYVRRSRPRFWRGEPAALATLHRILVTLAQLLAPFCPFLADEIYDNLDGGEPSVHLCDWPVPTGRDPGLEAAMAVARETVRMGQAARAGAKIKLRQPLRAAVVVATGAERAAIEALVEIVADELNVHTVRFVNDADDLGDVELKPNYRTLGKRFGKDMPTVAAAVAGLEAQHAAARLKRGETVGIDVGGGEHTLSADDVLVTMKPLPGYQVEREGSHAVALELEIDADLRLEGWAREIVHAVQGARRAAGLDISDRIVLTLAGDAELLDTARAHEAYITAEVLATSVASAPGPISDAVATVVIDGRELSIFLRRA